MTKNVEMLKTLFDIADQQNINAYAQFTEEIWFSNHRPNCTIFTDVFAAHEGRPHISCNCDQDSERSLAIMIMGLAGEVGEVMEILKKRTRDGHFEIEAFIKEMGDVFYYACRLAKHFGVEPSTILEANRRKLLDRKVRGKMRGSGNDR